MASGLYSHPGIPLEAHSNRVLSLARQMLDASAPVGWADSTRRALLELAIALHDFGKSTDFFQTALQGERRKDMYSRHAYLSALFFLHRALAWLEQKSRDPDDLWETVLFAYLAVKRHHTNLRSVREEIRAPDETDMEVLEEQIRHIQPEKVNAFLAALNLPDDLRAVLTFDPDAFLTWLREESPSLFRGWRRRWRQEKKGWEDASNFFAFLTGFSTLLDADKLEAGAKAHLPERVVILPNTVAQYKHQAFGVAPPEGLNALRERAYREVVNHPALGPERHLYTLTLPTGMGKTLTGMAAALKLRQLVHEKTGRMPRIIYALPFLSIIDQNAATLEKVLTSSLGQVDSRALIKHHHLADLQYRERDGDLLREWDYAASRLLIEGWHSEIVVTTFVQLFNTLLAWRNAAARRVNRLAGSILLLDEVQALPAVYWPLTRRLLTQVAENLGAYVILMTATQPYLLEEAQELVPEPERYFRALDRLDVFVDLAPTTLEDFVDRFKPKLDKSYLFMTNTIAAAQRLHSLIESLLGSEEEVVFLSTGVTPKERLERITALREGRYRFAVSTQLIEAGVDVDFDVIYRDMAPLDSLVQAAGRCNRNLTLGKRGEFHIECWRDENGRKFAYYIYDPVLLNHSEDRLKGHTRLCEPEFLGLLASYFRDVWETGIPHKVADELWRAVCGLRFDGERTTLCVRHSQEAAGAYLSQFCLIEAQPYKHDVFVQVDDEAVAVWNEAKAILQDLRKTHDVWAAHERFAKLKPRFAQYVISVALNPDNTPPWDDALRIYVVPHETRGVFYNPETGFKRQSGEETWIW